MDLMCILQNLYFCFVCSADSLVKAFSTKLGLAFPTQSQIFEVGQVCG